MDMNQVTLPALDIAESCAFYRTLGLVQIVDSPHYARFECPEGDATFSLHRVDGPLHPGAAVIYFEVDSVDEKVAELKGLGLAFIREPQDESWLWREARLEDPAGNQICIYRAGRNRKHPPWRVPST